MARQIIVADSLQWLAKQRDQSIPNVVTGICDLDELPGKPSLASYLDFFERVASLIFQKLKPSGYAFFIQTDRKIDRQLVDKSYLLSQIANQHGFKMIWHKIVLHREVGRTDLHRPTYAHILGYTVTGTSGAAVPDVLPVSARLYKNGTPLLAAEEVVKFIARYHKGTSILDPFVGQGTIVAVANNYGLDAIGIDIDPAQAKIAERQTL